MTDDELLTPRDAPLNNTRREAIFAHTQRRLRWTRRVHVGQRVAVGVLLFASGMGVMWLQGDAPSQSITIRSHVARVVSAPPPPPTEPRRLSPAELESEAERTFVKAEAAKRFREAGDRYFRDEGDYQAALRCYRNFLAEAETPDLAIRPEDTSLLVALKQARQTEN